jgi:hypothetical protein
MEQQAAGSWASRITDETDQHYYFVASQSRESVSTAANNRPHNHTQLVSPPKAKRQNQQEQEQEQSLEEHSPAAVAVHQPTHHRNGTCGLGQFQLCSRLNEESMLSHQEINISPAEATMPNADGDEQEHAEQQSVQREVSANLVIAEAWNKIINRMPSHRARDSRKVVVGGASRRRVPAPSAGIGIYGGKVRHPLHHLCLCLLWYGDAAAVKYDGTKTTPWSTNDSVMLPIPEPWSRLMPHTCSW